MAACKKNGVVPSKTTLEKIEEKIGSFNIWYLPNIGTGLRRLLVGITMLVHRRRRS